MAVGDWVPCVGYGDGQLAAQQQGGLTALLDVLLVMCGDALPPAEAEVGIVESQDEVLTKRVVGWVAHSVTTVVDTTFICHERIRVGLQQEDGDQSFYAENLNDQEDANEPFLWERCSILETTALVPLLWPNPTIGTADYGRIDVGVARKLRRSDVLVYSVQWDVLTATPLDPGDVLTTFPWLRTWARSKGA